MEIFPNFLALLILKMTLMLIFIIKLFHNLKFFNLFKHNQNLLFISKKLSTSSFKKNILHSSPLKT